MTDKVSTTGKIKTCRVHDTIRDFCLHEAYKYHFQEVRGYGGELVGDSISDLQRKRHISIDFKIVMDFISSQPYGPRVRSILCSSREEIILLPADVSVIADAFKLTRVLDVRSIRFTRFPFYLTQLVHLRYMEDGSSKASGNQCISHLMQGWRRWQWRRNPNTSQHITSKLHRRLIRKAINLKKLGIRGQLTMLLDDKGGSTPFDNLGKLQQLEKLKLLNDLHIHPKEAKLVGLPPPHKFPPKLISVTLSYTLLGWEQMAVLGVLENLKVLKLKNDAFTGERWEAADGGFRQLEVLQIEYTDLVLWEASSHHFPKLRHLRLRNCEELKALPFGLADVSSLQVIDLHRTTELAAASAREIQQETDTKGRRLKLSIFASYE
ncbi:UNVERIFIED_CONTAM: putative late blight resistance proteinR1B-12 [Sesamum angustifolium]|uniref:Late blight resistance proteinR1B-12 n=1 Tax=Sesamum angustifolium TaxID=2727405 RepID=A0AAW2K831_9LAMI